MNHETNHHRRRSGRCPFGRRTPRRCCLSLHRRPAGPVHCTATDDGNAVEVWCTDALDGDDWFFTVDNETELKIYSRVNLVIDANGTPDDFTDDRVIDALFCNDCTED